MINVAGVFIEMTNGLIPFLGSIFVFVWFTTWIASITKRV